MQYLMLVALIAFVTNTSCRCTLKLCDANWKAFSQRKLEPAFLGATFVFCTHLYII